MAELPEKAELPESPGMAKLLEFLAERAENSGISQILYNARTHWRREEPILGTYRKLSD